MIINKEILDNKGECNFKKLNSIDDKVSDLQTKIDYLKDAFLALNSAIGGIEFDDGDPINFDTSLVIKALASF